jgi:hypothetical protein
VTILDALPARERAYALLMVRALYALWMPTRLDEGPFRYFYRVINPITRMLVRRFGVGGPSDDLLRLLRVRGRASGRPYDVPVRINTLNGERARRDSHRIATGDVYRPRAGSSVPSVRSTHTYGSGVSSAGQPG